MGGLHVQGSLQGKGVPCEVGAVVSYTWLSVAGMHMHTHSFATVNCS